MDKNTAKQLFENGGTFITFDIPKHTELGIDMQSWEIGEKFKGIKMIPPGLHFIYYRLCNKYNESAPTCGFFHYFKEKDVLVKKFNPSEELLCDEVDEDKMESVKSNLKDLDSSLGPYPYDVWSKWVSLTRFVDEKNLTRLQPQSGRINSAPEYVNLNTFESRGSKKQKTKLLEESSEMETDTSKEPESSQTGVSSSINSDNPDDGSSSKDKKVEGSGGLPDMVPVAGTEIRFSRFPEQPYGRDSTPSEISRGNIDSTYTVDFILEQLSSHEDLLAEIQFSFACFLVGHVLDAWEHWKRLVIAVCKAEGALLRLPSFYADFLSILYYQIQEVPEDLFVDIVESNNFLVASLRLIFANVADNAPQLPATLVQKASKFRQHLSSKYNWNLELYEEGDDEPVVVDLEST